MQDPTRYLQRVHDTLFQRRESARQRALNGQMSLSSKKLLTPPGTSPPTEHQITLHNRHFSAFLPSKPIIAPVFKRARRSLQASLDCLDWYDQVVIERVSRVSISRCTVREVTYPKADTAVAQQQARRHITGKPANPYLPQPQK